MGVYRLPQPAGSPPEMPLKALSLFPVTLLPVWVPMIAVTADRQEDAELVQASRGGDTRAFEQLVERHKSLVLAICLAASGNCGEAEDTAQDAFLAAWSTLDRLRAPHKLRPWLCSIARNLAAKRQRDKGRERSRASELPEGEAMPDPLEVLVDRETEAQVRDALQAMPEPYREPLVLFYQEERSVRDIASALELSTDAVKQRLSRGRRILKEGIGEERFGAAIRRAVPSSAFTLAILASIGTASSVAHAAAAKTALSSNLFKGAVMTSTKTKLTIAAAAVAATLGVAAWTLVGSSRSPDAESSGVEDRVAASAPRLLSRVEGGARGGSQDPRLRGRELEARVAELEDELTLMSAQLIKQAQTDTLPRPTFFNLTDEEKLEMVKSCEVRSDIPVPLDEEGAAGLGLTDTEGEAWDRAWEEFARANRQKLVGLLEEATGERVEEVDWMQSNDVFMELAADGEVQELLLHMAQERAGLREPPSDLAGRSLYERWRRAFWARGDEFEIALANELGPERAHELRAVNDGWPGNRRLFHADCPKEQDAGE